MLADTLDHHTHAEVPHSPRAVLKRQIARLRAMGFEAMMASELEFFLFTNSYADLHAAGYRGMNPVSPYNEDYHIFQTTKEEDVMRAIRTGLNGAGIPVESSKGEASAGQEEINVSYADALGAADAHVVTKNAVKEIAWAKGQAVTFMAKYDQRAAGSSCHIHQSLRRQRRRARLLRPRRAARHVGADALLPRGPPRPRRRDHVFPRARTSTATSASSPAPSRRPRPSGPPTTAPPASASSARTAPRSASNAASAAPTSTPTSPSPPRSPPASPASRASWSSSPSSAATPTSPAALREIPTTLRDATEALRRSKMLRAAFGDEVVDHYVHAARWEQAECDRQVTDWELARGFERS